MSRNSPKRPRYPHSDVYVRLAPSRLHGVGVIAVRDIPSGTAIFGDDDAPLRRVPVRAVRRAPRELRRLYEDFCILRAGNYICPRSFNDLTVSWYLNHSKSPNVACDAEFRFWASRRIRKGEELLTDYDEYSEPPE